MSASSKASNRNRLGHVKHWAVDSNDPSAGESTAMTHVDNVYDANIVTSQTKEDPHMHTVVLDIDMDAELVPSSTEGHFHLYIDKVMTWADYDLLLQTLTAVGIIEPGYYGASRHRGFTAVRLPWVKKETVSQPVGEPVFRQSGFEPLLENQIAGTQLTESTVRRLQASGLATDAERTWLMNLDDAREAAGPHVWPTIGKDPL